MQTPISRIKSQFIGIYDGEPWYGDPIVKILKGISAQQAAAYPIPGAHSIWEIVLHLISWRRFGIEKLKGNAAYDVEWDSKEEWPAIPEVTGGNWAQTLAALAKSQMQILELLDAVEAEALERQVPPRTYSLHFLLQGIIQHDLYHAGQISMLKKYTG